MSKDIQIEHEQRLTRVEEAVITMVKTVDRMDQKVDKAVDQMRAETKWTQKLVMGLGGSILLSFVTTFITVLIKH